LIDWGHIADVITRAKFCDNRFRDCRCCEHIRFYLRCISPKIMNCIVLLFIS